MARFGVQSEYIMRFIKVISKINLQNNIKTDWLYMVNFENLIFFCIFVAVLHFVQNTSVNWKLFGAREVSNSELAPRCVRIVQSSHFMEPTSLNIFFASHSRWFLCCSTNESKAVSLWVVLFVLIERGRLEPQSSTNQLQNKHQQRLENSYRIWWWSDG